MKLDCNIEIFVESYYPLGEMGSGGGGGGGGWLSELYPSSSINKGLGLKIKGSIYIAYNFLGQRLNHLF